MKEKTIIPKRLQEIRSENYFYSKYGHSNDWNDKSELTEVESPRYWSASTNNWIYVNDMNPNHIKNAFIKLLLPAQSDNAKASRLIKICKDNKVDKWKVNYEGSCDSGSIDQVELDKKFEKIQVNKLYCDCCKAEEKVPLKEFIEDVCYDILECHHGGWEINEGSSGEFNYEIGIIKLTHDLNIIETNTSEFEYEEQKE